MTWSQSRDEVDLVLRRVVGIDLSLFFSFSFYSCFYFAASGQSVVTGVVPPPPLYVPSDFRRAENYLF